MRWVLVETGANQEYIFGSARLRHVVGASQLVHEVGTGWVPEAVGRLGLSRDSVVMTASGKALLLVDSAEAGRAVIRDVTGRALAQAPGLRVTGAVGPAFDPLDPAAHEPARASTYQLHARVRAMRPDGLVRDRVFPWHQLCRDSGRPAAVEEHYGDEPGVPASAGVLARSRAGERAGRRLRDMLGAGRADVVPAYLDELRHSGWIAVVHADGNGVGALFRGFVEHVARVEGTDQVSLTTHARYQRDVARELDEATWAAVRDAVDALAEPDRRDDIAGRLLPVVVGGDDVTVACDAALAVPFAQAFASAFARHTAAQQTLSAITRVATGASALTASAGIAMVKLHHPFATAYRLAEALTASAKRFRPDGRALAGLDFHVAHASTLRDLAKLREYIHRDKDIPVARHAGPYLLGDPADLPEQLRHRSVDLLCEVAGWLAEDGWLSATQAHALREAADRSLAEYEQQVELVAARADDPDRARQMLAVQPGLTGPEGADPPRPFLRLFDALHLRGLRLQADDRSTLDATSMLGGGS
jgi:hypothetical protein